MSKIWNIIKKELLSAQQLADRVGVSRRRIQQIANDAVKAGIAVKVGKITIYHNSSIQWFNNYGTKNK